MCTRLAFLLCFAVGVVGLCPGSVLGQTYDLRIATAMDDIEEYVSTGGMSGTSSDLEMPYEDSIAASEDQIIGLRWSVPIGAGVKISKAYVEFNCDEVKMTGAVNLIITGQLVPNAPAFATSSRNLSNRAQTKTQVKWSPEAWPNTEEKHKTADVSAIIQEIVDQPGWATGNALVLLIRDDKGNPSQGTRCADAYEDTTTACALLHLEISKAPAGSPTPASGATDVAPDVVLSWRAGENATAHNVYFGTDPANLSSVSQGQTGTTYTPSALLAYGQTYYWRVDEIGVNNAIVSGATWTFTVEPSSYALAGKSITATASGGAAGMGPEKTIDGSGLTGDQHGTDAATMWMNGGPDNWIQYQFDAVYQLDKMLVWNYNQTIEPFLGFGAKDVTVEYSFDGATWTVLAGVPSFAQGPGTPGYTANTTVTFGGVMAQYVKLTINKTWSGLPTAGLSEVRFCYIPVQARGPQPANAATGVAVNTTLTWVPGRDVNSHKVFLGTDQAAVTDGTATATTATDHSFTPTGLAFGTTYYWRVDEVGTATYPGAVWSFTTEPYAIVEGFESYDDFDHRVYDTWIDGFDNPKANGGVVGYNPTAAQLNAGTLHFVETTTVHGGKQAMPFFYDNTAGAPLSEATRTFAPAQDWTVGSAKTLVLFVSGASANTGGQLYLKINGSKVSVGTATTVKTAGWTQYNVDLPASANLKAVKTLTLGVEAGGKGQLLFDDLLLYANAPAATGMAALDVRLASATDDMEEYVSTGAIQTTSSDIEMPYEDTVGTNEQLIGLRYILNLPQGAKIGKAYVTFTCDETKGANGTQPVNLIIQGQLIANAPAFTSAAKDLSNRTTRTKAQVKWSPESWTAVGQQSQTADLSSILQELVNQTGWASGNAIALLLSDDKSNPSTGIRGADAYEDSTTTCAVLHLEVLP